jgi:hypothetical protein
LVISARSALRHPRPRFLDRSKDQPRTEAADQHWALAPAHCSAYLASHCEGQKVLQVKRGGGGVAVTAGVQHKKPDDHPPVEKFVVKDALSSPSLVQVVEGINRCLPDLTPDIRSDRNVMARNLLMHSCADRERALAKGAGVASRTSWSAAGSGLIDAIVGLWLAPVTPDEGDAA